VLFPYCVSTAPKTATPVSRKLTGAPNYGTKVIIILPKKRLYDPSFPNLLLMARSPTASGEGIATKELCGNNMTV
jgi:hypothetical protein